MLNWKGWTHTWGATFFVQMANHFARLIWLILFDWQLFFFFFVSISLSLICSFVFCYQHTFRRFVSFLPTTFRASRLCTAANATLPLSKDGCSNSIAKPNQKSIVFFSIIIISEWVPAITVFPSSSSSAIRMLLVSSFFMHFMFDHHLGWSPLSSHSIGLVYTCLLFYSFKHVEPTLFVFFSLLLSACFVATIFDWAWSEQVKNLGIKQQPVPSSRSFLNAFNRHF